MTPAHQTGANREASLRRVAIVLSSLPSSVAMGLLSSFDDATKTSLRRTMTSLSDVDPLERQRALQAFKGSLESQQPATTASYSQERDEVLLRGHQESDPALASAVRKQPGSDAPPHESTSHPALSLLGDVEDDVLVDGIAGEHPQAVALVLASISPAQAARILPQLDADVQQDALSRIGRLNDVPEEAVQELAVHLRDRVQQSQRSQPRMGAASTGQRALSAILAAMPKSKPATSPSASAIPASAVDEFIPSAGAVSALGDGGMNRILDATPRHEPGTDEIAPPEGLPHREVDSLRLAPQSTAVQTEASETVHQQLIALAPEDLCQALGQVETREAMLTLCGLPKQVAEAVLRVFPRPKAKHVPQQKSRNQSLELREIDEAKSAVATAWLNLNAAPDATVATPTTIAA
ncbi:MAG: hypothetical protein ACF788_00295 [Novipirellula sp. JB048]